MMRTEMVLMFVCSIFPDKALKEVVERILQTSYFDSTHNHQNGLCEEEEAAPAPAVEDTAAEAGEKGKMPVTDTFMLFCLVSAVLRVIKLQMQCSSLVLKPSRMKVLTA